jgi:hypothetical protein
MVCRQRPSSWCREHMSGRRTAASPCQPFGFAPIGLGGCLEDSLHENSRAVISASHSSPVSAMQAIPRRPVRGPGRLRSGEPRDRGGRDPCQPGGPISHLPPCVAVPARQRAPSAAAAMSHCPLPGYSRPDPLTSRYNSVCAATPQAFSQSVPTPIARLQASVRFAEVS